MGFITIFHHLGEYFWNFFHSHRGESQIVGWTLTLFQGPFCLAGLGLCQVVEVPPLVCWFVVFCLGCSILLFFFFWGGGWKYCGSKFILKKRKCWNLVWQEIAFIAVIATVFLEN